MKTRMTRKHRIASLLVAAALGTMVITNAGSKAIDLPPDSVQLKASSLPGYTKAQASCTACHSAEYMLYQPPTAPRAYWDTMVKRMKAVFKSAELRANSAAFSSQFAPTAGSHPRISAGDPANACACGTS